MFCSFGRFWWCLRILEHFVFIEGIVFLKQQQLSISFSRYVTQTQFLSGVHHHVTLPARIPLTLSRHHRSQEVFQATSCIGTELLYVGSSWLSNLCSSIWRGPQDYTAYKFILTSPAVSCMSGSSKLNSFHDEL